MPTASFDLVIFDCDGVLVDSEVISTRTLIQALAAHGLETDLAHVRKTYLGRAMHVVRSDYERRTGRALADGFEADFLERLFTAYRRDLVAMAGVRALIEGLRTRYCMATSSPLERATLSLEVTGLSPLFEDRVFCAAMVAHGKPAPDLFLLAAQSFAVDPARCLVIEDSEVGIEAAKNAGMEVWRFVGGSHFQDSPAPRPDADPRVRLFHSMDVIAAALGVE